MAQHALVLESGSSVKPNPLVPAQAADSTIQLHFTQQSVEPKSPCLAPRAPAIKEEGFSEAVVAQIDAPQRGSTRSVNEAKQTGAKVIR